MSVFLKKDRDLDLNKGPLRGNGSGSKGAMQSVGWDCITVLVEGLELFLLGVPFDHLQKLASVQGKFWRGCHAIGQRLLCFNV